MILPCFLRRVDLTLCSIFKDMDYINYYIITVGILLYKFQQNTVD